MLELGLLIASITMLFGWIYEGRTNNAGVVDVLWSGLMMGLPILYATHDILHVDEQCDI